MEFSIIAWDAAAETYFVRDSDGTPRWYGLAENAVAAAAQAFKEIRCDTKMPSGRMIELIAAAVFAGRSLYDLHGKIIEGTPVPEAGVRYITRAEIGAILPDGWFVEVQLNRYSAMWGEEMSLPARSSLAAAISDIHTFLAASIKQASDDLLASFQAQIAAEQEQQLPMWLSSDSPKGAVD